MEGDRFCTHCGAELPEGALFCAECGYSVGGQGPASQYAGTRPANRESVGFAFLILFYGIFAVVLGLMDMVSSLGMNEATYNEIIEMMTGMTGVDAGSVLPAWSDSLPVTMAASMGCLAASGVLALACYMMCRKGENWKLAVILCAASSVVCLGMCVCSLYTYMGVPLFVVGLVITLFLYTKRNAFAA